MQEITRATPGGRAPRIAVAGTLIVVFLTAALNVTVWRVGTSSEQLIGSR
jgi:hypothetical protein